MIKFYFSFGLTLITLFSLAGCGFKLRTTNSLPPQLQQIYYQTDNPYSQFAITFKKALKASKVVLLATPNPAAPILRVTTNYSYNITSPTSSVEARVYNLTYTATINITDAAHKQILAPQTVTVTRTISLQPNEIFETTPQIEVAKQEMLQELTTNILNILCAKNTFQAFTSNNENTNSTTKSTAH